VKAFVKPPVIAAHTLFGRSVTLSLERALIGSDRERSSVPGVAMNPNGTEPALTDGSGGGNQYGAAYVVLCVNWIFHDWY
jgi:hypothetical protein